MLLTKFWYQSPVLHMPQQYRCQNVQNFVVITSFNFGKGRIEFPLNFIDQLKLSVKRAPVMITDFSCNFLLMHNDSADYMLSTFLYQQILVLKVAGSNVTFLYPVSLLIFIKSCLRFNSFIVAYQLLEAWWHICVSVSYEIIGERNGLNQCSFIVNP